MLLELKNVSVSYQKVVAVRDISLHTEETGFITLVGSNGAGKSTTLRAISGLERPQAGEILFDGKRIDHMSADRILRAGIAHVPENRRVFKDLTVMENMLLGAYARKDKDGIRRDTEAMFAYFPRLRDRQKQLAKTMSGGEQQMLAIARALMSGPRLLLLDEPSMGLAPVIVQEIARILIEINKRGMSIILVEQNAELALELARYGYVFETGRIALEGDTGELQNNKHVREAYLGI
ncbi:MAG: ABC transporter ATP-binding protein [Gammaproteobacteria bacterium]|nr:ABC transporter ATP-binding protein [Gammaproteobacteria bacterium]